MLQRILLNKDLRLQIINNVMQEWYKENLKPPRQMISTEDYKRYAEYRNKERAYRHSLDLALSTFRNIKQLMDEWPEMMNFVPTPVLRPRDIILPKAPS